MHAIINKTHKGKLILLDKESKYGTFTLIQNTNLQLIPFSSLAFSIRNNIFDLKIRFKCNFLDCIKFIFKKKDYTIKKIETFYQEVNEPFVTREKHNFIKVETFSDEKNKSSEEDRKENNLQVN